MIGHIDRVVQGRWTARSEVLAEEHESILEGHHVRVLRAQAHAQLLYSCGGDPHRVGEAGTVLKVKFVLLQVCKISFNR